MLCRDVRGGSSPTSPPFGFITVRKGRSPTRNSRFKSLESRERFNEFYCLFERGGLLPSRAGQQPRALELLRRTAQRQKEVGEDLYKSYQSQRLRLIDHLKSDKGKSLDEAIRIAQKNP